MPNKEQFIQVMAKHLPPSASELRLLDIGGVSGDILRQSRPDVSVENASLALQHWHYPTNSVDSVVAYDIFLKPQLLAQVLDVMRSGGRFIIVNPMAIVQEQWVTMLEDAGYIRILVEPATPDGGVLIRGEKPHKTDDTLQRVADVAHRDADVLDLDQYRGRFVHLLILQTPNKPVWRMTPDEQIEWQAVSVLQDSQPVLLAFSSLAKAVSFMQSAVLDGFVVGVNKVGKFSKETAKDWTYVTLLNPILSDMIHYHVQFVAIDPKSAEASDE